MNEFFKSAIRQMKGEKLRPEEIAAVELEKIASQFFISRTGVEMLDSRKADPLVGELPPIFEQNYGANRKLDSEYDALDEQSMILRDQSSSIGDYRNKALGNHYANCTMLACFVCDTLSKNKVDAKIFGIGASHHFVIAKTGNPYTLLVVDPWAGVQFPVTLKEKIVDLEKLSVSSRLAICEAHFNKTNLYPESEYTRPFKEFNSIDADPALKEKLIKQAYSISTIERFFEFEDKSKLIDTTRRTP